MTTKSDKIRSLFLSALMVMSVFAGAAAFAGTAAANTDDADKIIEGDSTVIFQGQIAGATGFVANEEVTVEDEDGIYQNSYTTDDDGDVTFSSNNYEGQYTLTGPDGADSTQSLDFQVVEQNFNPSLNTTSVTTEASEFTFDVGDSNRATEFQVTFTAEGYDDYEETVTVQRNQDDVAVDLPENVETGNLSLTADVADTTASESLTLEVTEQDASYSLANPYPSDERGDVGTFTVELEDTTDAVVQFGSEDVSYAVEGTVVDADDDGEVTVQVHTYQTDSEASDVLTVAGDDEINSQDYVEGSDGNDLGPLSEGVIEAGDYDITVYDTENREEQTFGTFVLNERSTDGAQTWVASDDADPSDTEGIYNAISESDTVASGDYAIVEVEASGLYDYFEDESDLGDENGLSVDITETNPSANQNPDDLNDAFEVVTDAENNTFFIVADTSDAAADENYQATFTIDGDNNDLVADGETESVNSTFTVADRSVSFDTNQGDTYVVPQGEAEVSGTSTLAPGTEFQVTARSTAANLLQSRTVTVQDDGTWSADFDFSDVDNSTEFTFTNSEVDGDTAAALVNADFEDGPEDTTEPTETTTTPEETTTTTTTTETTTTEVDTTTTTETTEEPEDNDGGIPGFGVSVALVAIIAAALLALRRSN